MCRVADTQVTVKACWPLVFSNLFAGTHLVDISLQSVVETPEWRGFTAKKILCPIECQYQYITQ